MSTNMIRWHKREIINPVSVYSDYHDTPEDLQQTNAIRWSMSLQAISKWLDRPVGGPVKGEFDCSAVGCYVQIPGGQGARFENLFYEDHFGYVGVSLGMRARNGGIIDVYMVPLQYTRKIPSPDGTGSNYVSSYFEASNTNSSVDFIIGSGRPIVLYDNGVILVGDDSLYDSSDGEKVYTHVNTPQDVAYLPRRITTKPLVHKGVVHHGILGSDLRLDYAPVDAGPTDYVIGLNGKMYALLGGGVLVRIDKDR